MDASDGSSNSSARNTMDSIEIFASGARSPSRMRSQSPLVPREAQVNEVLSELEKSGALPSSMARDMRSGLADRAGLKRPPPLNLNLEKDTGTRGSLTSLSELIKRATRLAANLDRGRTASRLGSEWIDASSPEEKREIYDKSMTHPNGQRRSRNSLTTILGMFAPPGLGTPSRSLHSQSPASPRRPETSRTAWPQRPAGTSGSTNRTPGQYSHHMPPRPQRRQRRCCGLPLWGFISLVTILIFLAALVIVIPIALIILPRNAEDPSKITAQCAQSTPCQNGGSSVIDSNGQCACMCSNGFTGTTCTIASDPGCTTIPVPGTSGATIGNAIPRLIDDAVANYSISLGSQTLLALFSFTNLSCGAENALVTLNGKSGLERRFIMMTSSMTGPSIVITDEVDTGLATNAILVEPLQDIIDLADSLFHTTPSASLSLPLPTIFLPAPSIPLTFEVRPKLRLCPRQGSNLVLSENSGVAITSNGLVVTSSAPATSATIRMASPPVPSASATTSADLATDSSAPPKPSSGAATGDGGGDTYPSTTNTTTNPSGGDPPSSSDGSIYFSPLALDFARIVTLFILQILGKLDVAVTAQERFQTWFDGTGGMTSLEAGNITLGAGIVTDLAGMGVTLGNGTLYGGNRTSSMGN
ncbi:hypothetical protein LTS18_009976 [Coniosporium uncinatum]|uniref:Uncharacterized protein n=1 Tax=Coniosporium uncinatum TaxID=93489 RepID=A0ACC3CZZ2_9PEZI|nr:hypothetical protein LTS18_009976 [Coniosporium uncinatum]